MLKLSLGIFLIAHGLVHAILGAAPDPNATNASPFTFFTEAERSWLLSQSGLDNAAIRWIGTVLVVFSTLGFVLAGMGLLGVPGLSMIWRTVAIVTACVSLLLLILFWHTWLVIGILIDVVVLVALVWFKWPPPQAVGS
jgi:hypothetical protein